MYSDVTPGENDLEITDVGKGKGGKSGHVKITSWGFIDHHDYQVADNGYVEQSLVHQRAIRGVTKQKWSMYPQDARPH